MRQTRFRLPLAGSLLSLVCILAGALALLFAVPAQAQTNLYASPSGSSTSTCDSSTPCTLARAQAYVETLTPSMTGDIIVNLAAGTYTLSSTWTFNSANGDSGTGGYNVIWQASGYGTSSQASVTISGGQPVTATWTLWDSTNNIWKAAAPVNPLNTRQLYVNGTRAVRATGPLPVTLSTNGLVGFTASSNAMASWHNPSAIEFVFITYQSFGETRCDVSSISGTAITMVQPCFGNTSGTALPSWVENAYELLSAPGQWYLDTSGSVDGSGVSTIYYIPRSGESMSTATVIAPVVETLVSGTGTLATPLQNIQFKGLTFAYGTWLAPSGGNGALDVQTNMYATGTGYWGLSGSQCCYLNSTAGPGAVDFSAAHNIRLEGNLFIHLGGVGLNFQYGSQSNTVIGNEFADISSTGIQLGNFNDYQTSDNRTILSNNTVQDNYIHDSAVEYVGGVGIFEGHPQNSVVTHNQIDNMPYDGISSGGMFGQSLTVDQNNQFTNNLIFNYMETLYDGGGIYTNGAQGTSYANGTTISGNVVHDQVNPFNAFYDDEGSAYVTLQNNVTYNIATNSWGGCYGAGDPYPSQYMTFENSYIPEAQSTLTQSSHWGCGIPANLTVSGNTQISGLSACQGITGCNNILNGAGLESAWQCLLTESCNGGGGGGGSATVDDSVTGTGLNQFNYVGSSWGSCVGLTACGSSASSYYNNSDSWDYATNDYVLFKFTGTQVKFYGVYDPAGQQLGVSLCDQNGANCGTETIVDEYGASTLGNQLMWTSAVQTSGTYTMKVRLTGQHNANAVPKYGSYYGTIDRADVIAGTTTVDDSVTGTGLNQFNYVGSSWGSCVGLTACGSSASSYYNNSDSWDYATNDYVLFKFTGTQVKFYGVYDPAGQQLGVSLCDQNGANCGAETIVDEYAASTLGNQLMWTSAVQTSGTYTMKVRLTGQHNANAVPKYGSYYGMIDRADVVQ